ncbi:hypothetical protein KC727_00215 [Candidatus Kaiserbacteria bacterium]|nr:hypothetical protein [Candidatus Kaiserbacteria bacterium]
MLIAFYGTDTSRVRQEAQAYSAAHTTEETVAEQFSPDTYVVGSVSGAVGATSLFGNSRLIVIDTPSEDPDMFAEVWQALSMCAASPHTVVLIESGLDAPERKALEKHADECTAYALPAKKEASNIFSLADALTARNKRALWTGVVSALRNGSSGEEIIGTLLWQLKVLRLARQTEGPDEAGQKPFVYNKAKRTLQNFKEGELEKFSRELLSIYHDGHRGKRDIEVALERWMLSI